jgi:hypothetical protein
LIEEEEGLIIHIEIYTHSRQLKTSRNVLQQNVYNLLQQYMHYQFTTVQVFITLVILVLL